MHKRIFVLFLFVLSFSCNNKPPADVLSPQKMTEIITDLQLADAAYKLDMLPESYANQPQKYFVEILATHQTDSATYNRSMRYYAEKPKLLKKIYFSVEKNLKQQNLKK